LHSPSLEKLTVLRPDLVIVNSAQAPFLEDTLKALGLRILKTSNASLQEVYGSMIAIGHATGNESQAARLVAATREGLDRVARTTSRLPKSRVVLIIDRTPGTLRDLYTATDGSFLAELVAIAGGRLVASPVETGYKKLSTEDLLATDPDIILDSIQGSQKGSRVIPGGGREMPTGKRCATGALRRELTLCPTPPNAIDRGTLRPLIHPKPNEFRSTA
jgi:iron complex transport system substrate-binding protein